MPEARQTHSPETKAAAMAALLQGQSINEVARDYKLPRGTVSKWAAAVRKDGGASIAGSTKKEEIGDLLTAYLAANLAALASQARAFSDADWLARQNAADLAVLHGVMTDKAVRLIEAFGRAAGDDDDD